jgi:hypothetical protein
MQMIKWGRMNDFASLLSMIKQGTLVAEGP